MKPSGRKVFLLWMFFLVAGLIFFQLYEYRRSSYVSDFNYPKFIQALSDGEIKKDSIVFNTSKQEIAGELTESGVEKYKGEKFRIQGNVTDKGFELLRDQGITPSYVNTDNSFWTSVLLNWLPILIFAGLFIFFIRQLQIGGGKALAFGKSRARLVADKKKVVF